MQGDFAAMNAIYTETPEKIAYNSRIDEADDWYMLCNAGRGTDCLVYLHGHGSRGDQLFTRADIKIRLPFIAGLKLSIIAPDLRGNSWMCPTVVSDLAGILTSCRENTVSNASSSSREAWAAPER